MRALVLVASAVLLVACGDGEPRAEPDEEGEGGAGGGGDGGAGGGTPTPVVLATTDGYLIDLVVVDDTVLWAERALEGSEGSIRRMPLDGSAAAETIWTDAGAPTRMRAYDGRLYLMRLAEIQSIPLEGGETIVHATNLVNADDVAVDATTIYFTEDGGSSSGGAGRLSSVPRAGGQPTLIASTQGKAGLLALDDDYLYVANHGDYADSPQPNGGAILRLPKDEPPEYFDQLAKSLNNPNPTDFVVAPAFVYWTDDRLGSVLRVPAAGGEIESLTAQKSPVSVVADDDALYVLGHGTWNSELQDFNVDGEVVRLSLDGETRTVLASGLAQPYALDESPQQLVWLNRGDGTVMRLAK
jgi:hypothetical protein